MFRSFRKSELNAAVIALAAGCQDWLVFRNSGACAVLYATRSISYVVQNVHGVIFSVPGRGGGGAAVGRAACRSAYRLDLSLPAAGTARASVSLRPPAHI